MKRKGNYAFSNDRGEKRCNKRTSKVFKKYIRSVGYDEKFTMHHLRHTFASHLVQRGCSIYKVSQLLGHLDIKTTEVYAHLAPEKLHSDLGLLNLGGQASAGMTVVRKSAEG